MVFDATLPCLEQVSLVFDDFSLFLAKSGNHFDISKCLVCQSIALGVSLRLIFAFSCISFCEKIRGEGDHGEEGEHDESEHPAESQSYCQACTAPGKGEG